MNRLLEAVKSGLNPFTQVYVSNELFYIKTYEHFLS